MRRREAKKSTVEAGIFVRLCLDLGQRVGRLHTVVKELVGILALFARAEGRCLTAAEGNVEVERLRSAG